LHVQEPHFLCNMIQFENLLNDDKIISYLCKVRVKVAKQRNKKHLLHLLTSDDFYNYHEDVEISEYQKEFLNTLKSIFPPRRKWKKLGQSNRIRSNGNKREKLSTSDKYLHSLIKTVKYYRRNDPSLTWVQNLNNYIKNIKASIQDPHYKIATPNICPRPKDKKKLKELKKDEYNICRPISIFNLKDRLILSFVNNYLTRLFDKYFDSSSLAFRAKPHQTINHHTAIRNILTYKALFKNTGLWVAECDMQKFFDSVNHKIIIEQFESLIFKASRHNPDINLDNCKRLFYEYLNCYAFNKTVLPLNEDGGHWTTYNIPRGKYGWIDDAIKQYKLYDNPFEEQIGIPQGGALSGLIANIVLDAVDRQLMDTYPSIFYARFCDDMIIMYPDQEVCQQAINIYIEKLFKLKLAPHSFSSELTELRLNHNSKLPLVSFSNFWKGKSKGPYKWDAVENDGFPWIGFVGYEIHHEGLLRVRKSSLEKEFEKQKKTVNDIKDAIKKHKRVSNGTVAESAIRRLIGMSVGRVELWNYSICDSEMCWKVGFQELNLNKHSIRQMKSLDRNRNKLYFDLIRGLKEDYKDEVIKDRVKYRQLIVYNKPFSYYYHIIEKPQKLRLLNESTIIEEN
jgi:retron-type reverse transcriptase